MSLLQPIRQVRSPRREEIGQEESSPAPVLGWNTRDPLAAMRAGYALTLDNWWPTSGSVEVRKGAAAHATGMTGPVKSLATWQGPSSSKLFGITDAGIFDVTAAGNPGATVQALTEGYCNTINFTTSGGHYLVVVNGVDTLKYYNGTVWAATASFPISGGGTLLSSDIDNINAFKRSIFFIEKNSMNFHYLPIDSITGTVGKFPLGALFTKGGKLVAMGTWTVDGGTGPEDYSAFVSSEGQVAVYAGTDPTSVTTWALKGVYDVDPPLGQKCFRKFAGDLLLLTRRGLLSLTTSLRDGGLDPSKSMSGVIGEAFLSASSFTGTAQGWEVIEQPDFNALLVNVPTEEFTFSHQYVMNTRTGAWARFKGWNGFAMCYYEKTLYMAIGDGVMKVWQIGNDIGASITAEARGAFNYYKPRSRLKKWNLIRPNLQISGVVAINIGVDTDFALGTEYGQAIFNTAPTSRWDIAEWDSAQWSSEAAMRLDWVTVACNESNCAAIRLRVIMRDATIAWSATDVVYEQGSLL